MSTTSTFIAPLCPRRGPRRLIAMVTPKTAGAQDHVAAHGLLKSPCRKRPAASLHFQMTPLDCRMTATLGQHNTLQAPPTWCRLCCYPSKSQLRDWASAAHRAGASLIPQQGTVSTWPPAASPPSRPQQGHQLVQSRLHPPRHGWVPINGKTTRALMRVMTTEAAPSWCGSEAISRT